MMLDGSWFQQCRGPCKSFLTQTCTAAVRLSWQTENTALDLFCITPFLFFFHNTHLLKQLLSAVLCALSIWTSLLFLTSPARPQNQGVSRIFSLNCLVWCFSLFKGLPVLFKYLKRIQHPPLIFRKGKAVIQNSSFQLETPLNLEQQVQETPDLSWKVLFCFSSPFWLPSPPSFPCPSHWKLS